MKKNTLYFFDGELQVFLNAIHPMKSDEYESEETAKMVGETLMSTLGLTKEQLKMRFVSVVYDGVYATKEQRTKGGGSLKLKEYFAECWPTCRFL